jgi:hypothetical protein
LSKNKEQKEQKNEIDKKDKKVPIKYETKAVKALETIDLKLQIDAMNEKVKLMVFEDGTDEQFLKLVKAFRNMIEAYELWEPENGVKIIYQSFHQCLSGATRDLWDQINILKDNNETRDKLPFEDHLWNFTQETNGSYAYRSQKEYLKRTAKPERISVKLWLIWIKN